MIAQLIFLSLIAPILCYPSGAPSIACESMNPDHKVPAQTSQSPYKVSLNTTKLGVKGTLELILTSKSGRDIFKGFLVQIRKLEDGEEKPFGDFLENDNARALACFNTHNNAITHKSPEPKQNVKVHWIPKMPGKYRVYTTFVLDGGTFWTKVAHDEIIYVMDKNSDHSDNSDHSAHSEDHSMHEICSTLKWNTSLVAQTASSNPYDYQIEPIDPKISPSGDLHKVYQKGLLWIHVNSTYGTPIKTIYLQVRHKQNHKAYGKFIAIQKPSLNYKLIDCFDMKENSVLFMNTGKLESDVSFKWEAPEDQVGDFQVVGTIFTGSDFWDHIGKPDDSERSRITVIKPNSSPNSSPNKKGDKNKKNSSAVINLSYSILTLTILTLISI